MTSANNKKRTLTSFFQPIGNAKKLKLEVSKEHPSIHKSYPFAIPQLPTEILDGLEKCPPNQPEKIDNEPHLDLIYYKPYISHSVSKQLFEFLRNQLFYQRVVYDIKRGGFSTTIKTPRYTTVFGIDATSRFDSIDGTLLDAQTGKPVPKERYKCSPRPIPNCLDVLRKHVERETGHSFNFCLVNYYASGDDSISFHSDDEQFLGPYPTIASFSLGVSRDFLMKHKPPKQGEPSVSSKTLKFSFTTGDMILMKGTTQSNWLHSIPKRKGNEYSQGRINITFRKALVKGGTENYNQYNVGSGPVYKWDEVAGEMMKVG